MIGEDLTRIFASRIVPGSSLPDGLQKRCRVCGGTYHVRFFQPHRATCRGCKQRLSDEKKARDRFPTKVQWSRRHHARRLGLSSRQLRDVFGWTDARMLTDVRRVWADGCPSCEQTPRWLHLLTLRLLDRTQPPVYGTNTVWVCTGCSGSAYVAELRGERR